MQTTFTVTHARTMISPPAKPFLNWAGGKSQLIQTLAGFFPPEMSNGETRKYVEPFNDVRY
jgi:DNA adenine methylase